MPRSSSCSTWSRGELGDIESGVRQLIRSRPLEVCGSVTAVRTSAPVAHQVLEAVHLSHPYGTTELLEGVVARARKLAADSERADVASEVQTLVARSGLSRQDFAERIGTSRSRLSTYMSGQVVPSAA